MGQERSEEKVGSEKELTEDWSRGQPRSLVLKKLKVFAETYFFNFHHVVLVYCRRKSTSFFFYDF